MNIFKIFILNEYGLSKQTKIEQEMWYDDLFKLTTIMSNFVTRCKIKFSKTQNEQNTLLDNHDHTNSLYIFENSIKYTFGYKEIKNIIVNNIFTLNEGTITINRIRNPYTNLPFKLHNLYGTFIIKYNINNLVSRH